MKHNNSLVKIFHLADYKYLFVFQIIATLLLSLVNVYIGDFARNIVDNDILESRLWQNFVRLIVITLLGIVLSYTSVYIRSKFSIQLVKKLRLGLVNKLVKMKYTYFENEHSGKMTNKLTYDVDVLQNYLSSSFVDFISSIIVFICSFVYLLTVNYAITLICAISVPITLLFVKVVTNPIYKTINNFADKMDDVTAIAKDSILGADIEKAYNLQNARKEKFDAHMDEATTHYVKYEKIVAIKSPFEYMIKALPTFICIALGFISAYRGTITSGEFIAFILLLRYISTPLSHLPSFVTELKETLVSTDRLLDMLDYEEEQFGTNSFQTNKTVIEFDNVSFKYIEEMPLLKNISFSIESGKTIAVVGASGCGKSTLFKLITGFHLPSEGLVKLYSNALQKWDIEEARSHMAIVSQDTHIFPDTVAANIGYGKPNATMDDIIQSAKLAFAHDFIMNLPEGYQTILAEWGANLSGGQKQRIAIARAFLKNAPILLLDEMTSALDVDSEKLIQKSLETYAKDKTVIVIAHRLSTIMHADEIIVLDKGQIVERGQHLHLIKENGVYSKLYSNQVLEVTS